MTKGSKFVAMTVAILVLATPVLASSSCWLPMAMTSDDAEHCLMMGVQPSFVSARQSQPLLHRTHCPGRKIYEKRTTHPFDICCSSHSGRHNSGFCLFRGARQQVCCSYEEGAEDSA